MTKPNGGGIEQKKKEIIEATNELQKALLEELEVSEKEDKVVRDRSRIKKRVQLARESLRTINQ